MKQRLLRITPIVLITSLTVIGLAWRFSSRRHQLPCPSWLGWMVECEVVAMDVQQEMLKRVQAKAQAADLQNVQYLQAGLGEGKVPQAHFDRAVLVTVLGEVPNRLAALQELFKALKPGGVLSVTEVIFDPHFQRRAAVVRAAQAAGFSERAFFGRSLAYTLHLEKRVNK